MTTFPVLFLFCDDISRHIMGWEVSCGGLSQRPLVTRRPHSVLLVMFPGPEGPAG